jgi:hypothetical protein
MTYRDRTFCDGNAGQCQLFAGCDRALSEDVLKAAERWWQRGGGKGGAPICQFAEPTELPCYRASDGPGVPGEEKGPV